MKTNFKTVVTMKVTKEQYQNELLDPLKKMGYNITPSHNVDFKRNWVYLSNAYNKKDYEPVLGAVGIDDNSQNSYFIDHYNKELYLAIAAMTEGEVPIVGEWMIRTRDTIAYKQGGLFKVKVLCNWNSISTGDIDINNPTGSGLFRKATLEELIKHFTKNSNKKDMDNRFPFTLIESDAKKIISYACNEWKNRLADRWGKSLLIAEEVKVNEKLYKAMRDACSSSQHELLDSIFGKDIKHIPKGTPCLVRDYDCQDWRLAYADGEGLFYNSAIESFKWECVHILNDLDNLPLY